MNPAKHLLITVLLLLLSPVFQICISIDTITPNQTLKDGQILVLIQKIFALGFFSSEISNHRYLGIWYNQITEQNVVCVANRDNPLNDTSGVLSINSQGNLVLHTQNRTILVWSTNVSVSVNSMARLLDIGNLLLAQQDSQRVTWQSFDYPTDPMLPFLKLGLDWRTKLNRFLTSWKSKDDPRTGNCSFGLDPSGYPQFFLYMGQVPLWHTGPRSGQGLSGVPEMKYNFIFNVSFVNNQDEITIMYSITDPQVFSRTRLVLDESRILETSTWHESNWVGFWSAPKESCDKYLECGPNS